MPAKNFAEWWNKNKRDDYTLDDDGVWLTGTCGIVAEEAYKAGYEEAMEEIRPQLREMAKILSGEKVIDRW